MHRAGSGGSNRQPGRRPHLLPHQAGKQARLPCDAGDNTDGMLRLLQDGALLDVHLHIRLDLPQQQKEGVVDDKKPR